MYGELANLFFFIFLVLLSLVDILLLFIMIIICCFFFILTIALPFIIISEIFYELVMLHIDLIDNET